MTTDAPRVVAEPHGGDGWREMVRLREAVLRAPLGLRFDAAELAAEDAQVHLALRRGDHLLGTVLVLRPDGNGICKLRQMAVRPDERDRGFGVLLVRAAEAAMRDLGATGARLTARADAIGFYRRLGYRTFGPMFQEVGLPHRDMRRRFTGERQRGHPEQDDTA